MPQNMHYWLMKQPPHQVRNMLLHPQKYLKSKKSPQKAKQLHQNWLLKSVTPQKAWALPDEGAMGLDSDLDGEDYYIVEDANVSASFEYVPCENYPNDKVYPEDEKNGWVRLDEDTGPPDIYRFEGSCQNNMDLNEYTPCAVLMSFLKIEYGQYWVKILINMFMQNSDKQKTMGTKTYWIAEWGCWPESLYTTE